MTVFLYLRLYLLQICTQRAVFFFNSRFDSSVWMEIVHLLFKRKIKLLMWKYFNVGLCNLSCSLIQRFNKTVSWTIFNSWLATKFSCFTVGMNIFCTPAWFFLSAFFSGSNSFKHPFGWFEELSAFCCWNSPWKHGSTLCGSENESKAMWNVLR